VKDEIVKQVPPVSQSLDKETIEMVHNLINKLEGLDTPKSKANHTGKKPTRKTKNLIVNESTYDEGNLAYTQRQAIKDQMQKTLDEYLTSINDLTTF